MSTEHTPIELPGNTGHVYVISPSGAVTHPERLKHAKTLLSRHGFKLTLDPKVRATWQQRFAGDDDTRLGAFERAIASDAPTVMTSRGGYGLTRYLPRLDFERLAASNKRWLGFSDFTAFHLAMLARAGAVTWAGPALCAHFGAENPADVDPTTLDTLADTLAGRLEVLGFRSQGAPSGFEAEGTLWGGNLAMTCALMGTPFFPHVEGGILFLEDVNEHPYKVERMLTQLLHAGVLDRQHAILIGDFSWQQAHGDRYDMNKVWRWLRSQTKTPVITGLPFGHEACTLTLPHGAHVGLGIDGRTCYLLLPHEHDHNNHGDGHEHGCSHETTADGHPNGHRHDHQPRHSEHAHCQHHDRRRHR
ncbi:MAG: LD-carboxypeptidase [Lautropia sp.]|nr:LD-carboxypeptidase [Lautropia sp.]